MFPANAILVFPVDAELRQLSGKRIPLTFAPPHARNTDGHAALTDPDGEVLNLEAFRRLRVKLGAWIETDDSECTREALGAPHNEPAILVARQPEARPL